MPSGAEPVFRRAGEADAAFAARVKTECVPHHPTTAEEVALDWRLTERAGEQEIWIVRAKGERGWLGLLFESGSPGHGYLEVFLPRAAPELLDRAIEFAERRGRRLGMKEMVAEPWEDEVALLRSLRALGFEQRRRDRFWRMDLRRSAERLRRDHTESLAAVRARGAEILPATELGGEDVYPALFEIHNRSHEDIPRSVTFVPEPWDVWLGWMTAIGSPDRVWVAVVEGRPVGYSYLAHNAGGSVETGYTGVLRDHRGRGIARALKLATLVQALDSGVDVVETDNDSENAPIIHLNQALGYDEITGKLELAKRLDGGPA